MTSQEDALVDLTRILGEGRVPYMIIGGLANIIWGEPRATLDIDVTVWADARQIPDIVARLGRAFTILVENALAFIDQTRVLPLESRRGVRVDIIFGLLPFEYGAIARATTVQIAGTGVQVCTPEDLILMKIVSDRECVLSDARGIIRRRYAELDRDYLEPRIRELSALLERPDIMDRWRLWSQITDLPPEDT
jgi:hypothetical protein